MIDLRRVAIIFVIAVLYAIFVNAFIGAFYTEPRQEDYCKTRFYAEKPYTAPVERKDCPKYNEPAQEELDKCAEQKGYPDYQRDAFGCPVKYTGCNFCQRDFDNANQKYNFTYFIFSSILAVVGIGIGLVLPTKNSLNEWIATGFILGGLVTLFFGTFRYYQYLGRYVKPVVILAELLIVIFLSYKKLRDIKSVESKPAKRKSK
ncbi:DUF202 domain-containing protein [Candidatus Woesearchaeota archaeon]|nr:DUF202 domain-containing protein [Candidatus Woesearchaeota archaeon]